MYYSASQKEIVGKDPDNYSDFGAPYKSFPLVSDPVDVCLPGNYMNPERSSNLDLNNCPTYMSQRCAVTWDDKCALYLQSLDDPSQLKDFIHSVAKKKFCRLTPGSSCQTLCQPFNPIAQNSPILCSNVGKEVLKNAAASIDIGWYLPVNMSPDYMGESCNQTCDNLKGIKKDDIIIDACLKYGFCNDILENVCHYSKGKPISHPGLKMFCASIPSPIPPPSNTARVNKTKSVKRSSSRDDGDDDLPVRTVDSSGKNKMYLLVALAIIVFVIMVIFFKK
jgi:hypothetical protein